MERSKWDCSSRPNFESRGPQLAAIVGAIGWYSWRRLANTLRLGKGVAIRGTQMTISTRHSTRNWDLVFCR